MKPTRRLHSLNLLQSHSQAISTGIMESKDANTRAPSTAPGPQKSWLYFEHPNNLSPTPVEIYAACSPPACCPNLPLMFLSARCAKECSPPSVGEQGCKHRHPPHLSLPHRLSPTDVRQPSFPYGSATPSCYPSTRLTEVLTLHPLRKPLRPPTHNALTHPDDAHTC